MTILPQILWRLFVALLLCPVAVVRRRKKAEKRVLPFARPMQWQREYFEDYLRNSPYKHWPLTPGDEGNTHPQAKEAK